MGVEAEQVEAAEDAGDEAGEAGEADAQLNLRHENQDTLQSKVFEQCERKEDSRLTSLGCTPAATLAMVGHCHWGAVGA